MKTEKSPPIFTRQLMIRPTVNPECVEHIYTVGEDSDRLRPTYAIYTCHSYQEALELMSALSDRRQPARKRKPTVRTKPKKKRSPL